MNIYKLLVTFLLAACVFTAQAETGSFVVAEVDNFTIKLNADGTGVMDNVSCPGCDFKSVLITKNSKVFIHSFDNKGGAEVSMNEAIKRQGQFATVSFDPETREVQAIRWWK